MLTTRKHNLLFTILCNWTVLLGEVLGMRLDHFGWAFVNTLQRLHILLKHFDALNILLTRSVLRGSLVHVDVGKTANLGSLLDWHSLSVVKRQTSFASGCTSRSNVLHLVGGLRNHLTRRHLIRCGPLMKLRLLVSGHGHCLLFYNRSTSKLVTYKPSSSLSS
jgi:hypothetical protein